MNLLLRRLTGTSMLLILPLCAITGTAEADDPDVNRLLASQCAQCHGTDGYARGDMDGLAGDEDLDEDLLDMKSEDRPEDIMDHQALGYTNDQIRRIASYYAGLPEDVDRDDEPDEEDEEEDEEEEDKEREDD